MEIIIKKIGELTTIIYIIKVAKMTRNERKASKIKSRK